MDGERSDSHLPPGHRRAAPLTRSRGFTVIEMLVVSGLMLVLLGALYLVFALGLRYSRQAHVYSHLQQQSALALQHLTRELSNALPDQFESSPGVLTGTPASYTAIPYAWFPSTGLPAPSNVIAAYDQVSGSLQLQKWVCFYLDAGNAELVRSEQTFTGGPVCQPLGTLSPTPSLALFQGCGGLQRKVLARSITRLDIELGDGNNCHIELTAAELNGSKPCSLKVESDVTLLNN